VDLSGFPDKIRETGNDADHLERISKIRIRGHGKACSDEKAEHTGSM
jgi:hypothetical protein